MPRHLWCKVEILVYVFFKFVVAGHASRKALKELDMFLLGKL